MLHAGRDLGRDLYMHNAWFPCCLIISNTFRRPLFIQEHSIQLTAGFGCRSEHAAALQVTCFSSCCWCSEQCAHIFTLASCGWACSLPAALHPKQAPDSRKLATQTKHASPIQVVGLSRGSSRSCSTGCRWSSRQPCSAQERGGDRWRWSGWLCLRHDVGTPGLDRYHPGGGAGRPHLCRPRPQLW